MFRLFVMLSFVCANFAQLNALNSPFTEEMCTFKPQPFNRTICYSVIVKNATDEPVSLVVNQDVQFKGKLIDGKNGRVLADFDNGTYTDIKRIKPGKSRAYLIEIMERDDEEHLILTARTKSGHNIADISVDKHTANLIDSSGSYYAHKYSGTLNNSCMIIFGESEESVDEAFSEESKKVNVHGMPPFYKK